MMAKKTWIYIAVAAGILVAAYLMFRPSSGTTWLGGSTPATSGTAGVIDASGRAAGGLSKLWTAIFGGSSSGDGSVSTNFSGDYYIDAGVG
jgi:hypothetical protein